MDVKSLTSGRAGVLTADELLAEAKLEFRGRSYAPGLMMALIDFFRQFSTPSLGLASFEDFLTHFPRVHGKGKTLKVRRPGEKRPVSLRPCYQRIEQFFRDEKHRGGYTSQPNHATIAASEYPEWLDSLVQLNDSDMVALRKELEEFVLSQYPSDEFDPSTAQPRRRPFKQFLREFSLTHIAGEPRGAALQGAVFGFLRADNPHLQVQIWKVHTGSRRKKGVGDIDCWAGGDLVISAEVKQFNLDMRAASTLTHFADEIVKRNAIGIVVALDISTDARKWLSSVGLIPLSLADIITLVSLWDGRKQDTAVDSLTFYVEKIERSAKLTARLRKYLADIALQASASPQKPSDADGAMPPFSTMLMPVVESLG